MSIFSAIEYIDEEIDRITSEVLDAALENPDMSDQELFTYAISHMTAVCGQTDGETVWLGHQDARMCEIAAMIVETAREWIRNP